MNYYEQIRSKRNEMFPPALEFGLTLCYHVCMTAGKKDNLKSKYNNFTVIREIPISERKFNYRMIEVMCLCGTIKVVALGNLRNKSTISCGCLGREHRLKGVFKHGQAQKTLIYSKWKGMKTRVNNKNRKEYKHYGGRGIKVCKRWNKFINFYDDMNDSLEIHLKDFGQKNTTLERVDNNKGYSPDNCKWATRLEQARNTRRTAQSKTRHLRYLRNYWN